MKGIAAVLLDLDGTLVDTAPDIAHALNGLRAERGLAALPLAEVRPVVARGTAALLAAALPAAADAAAAACDRERFLASYRACLAQHSAVYPGFPALLTALHERAIPWGVVTNKHTALAEPLLAALALTPACLVCGDTLLRAKPAPDTLLLAAERLGLPPARCLYLGDARGDVEAARAAGMPVAVALWGYLPAQEDIAAWSADFMLSRPDELLAALAA